jgi:uncharacterized protein YodC (DUF2158 family)
MAIDAGDVVVLKSGGQAMTVVEVDDEVAICIWLGEEGDFFRERIPLVALDALIELADEDGDDEDEDEEGDEDEGEDEKAAPVVEKAARKRKATV